MSWTQEKVNSIYAQVQNLAASDEAFRVEMLENPKSTIERIFDETLPDDFSIKVIDTDPAFSAIFALPPLRASTLSDDELNAVAGGFCTAHDIGACK